jgi:hypothetical protein
MTFSCFISSRFLNVLGLVISFVAALLICWFPMYANPIMRDKKARKWFESDPFEWRTREVPWWKAWRARIGPILLAVGFSLQIIATFITS